MSRIFLFFIIFLSFKSQAAVVKINGECDAPDQIVRLIVVKDYVSNLEHTLISTKTDVAGKFVLSIDLDEITVAQLALGLDRAEIVLSPGANYICKLSQTRSSSTVSYFEKEPLDLEVLESNDNGVQKNIDDINMIFNAFVMQYFDDLYRNKRIDLLDSLRIAIADRLPERTAVFVSDYNTYKQASLLQTIRGRSAEQWMRNLIIDKPVLYTNPEYMNLLNEVFRDYLISNRFYQQDELNRRISEGTAAFKQFISKNPLLKPNDQLIELVGLINLRDLYYNPSFKKSEIILLLKQFQSESKFVQHKKIAANIIESVNYLSFNSDAPAFTLKNQSAREVSLKDFRGRNLVLIFVQDSCKTCLNALKEVKTLYEKFSNEYDFVTIATTEGFKNYVKLFVQNDFKWTLLNLSENILLLEAYHVKTFPEFFLILKEGRMGMAPAPQPDQNLEYHMLRLKER
jgi:peroxiredoxin